VVYSAAKSNWYLQLAKKAAEAADIELVTRKVSTPRETISQLSALAGKVDALWMLPDTTAITRETAEAYFHFGQNNNIPVISFADCYLKLGAAAVFNIDRVALGRQAGAISAKILDDDAAQILPFNYPSGAVIKTNPAVLKRLGL